MQLYYFCLNQPTLTLGVGEVKQTGRGGEADWEGWVPGGDKQNHFKLTLFGWEEVYKLGVDLPNSLGR